MEVFNFIFNESPKITKILIISSFSISILVWTNLISAYDIYLNYSLIIKRFQIWRIFTSFFYFGEFNLSLVFNMYIFFRDSKILEKKIFHGNCADYLYFIIYCMVFLLIIGIFTKPIFLSSSLNFAIMYYWGRKCKTNDVLFMGVFTFRAPYLSIFYLLISFLLGYDYANLIYGIICWKFILIIFKFIIFYYLFLLSSLSLLLSLESESLREISFFSGGNSNPL